MGLAGLKETAMQSSIVVLLSLVMWSFLGVYGPVGYFSLTFMFWDFHSYALSMVVVS